MIRRRHRSVSPRLALAALVALVAACQDSSGPPATGGEASLLVTANVSATSATLLVVTVEAADISPAITLNIPVVAGMASGTLTLTAGSSRIITVRAYDAASVETHRGVDTITVNAGSNPPLSLTLVPLTGDVPIVVTLVGIVVTITPKPDTLVAGGLTVTLSAAIATATGAPVSGTVTWATLDPGVATVSSTGQVSGVAHGTTQIVASFAGVAGTATIVVYNRDEIPPALQQVGPGFDAPVLVTAPPGDTLRIFVVEQSGRIRVMRRDTLLATPFLDLHALITCCGEQGLLGLAFHPQYVSNGFFFVNYIDLSGNTQVKRFHVSADPNVADATSSTSVLSQAQPFSNHNGGNLAFGPDGFLYVGLGDGGSGGDPQGNGQKMSTWLGKLLRLNVNGAGYTVPASNPFIGRTDTLPEIWASGLRNPWRFSFDRQTGDLYIGDVGQGEHEEVDVQPSAAAGGRNYGWNTMEGLFCYNAATCNQTGLTLPLVDYTHSAGCSVTGGYVYRGAAVTMLTGLYFYSDYCNGFVKSFRYTGGVATTPQTWPAMQPGGSVSSFGEDGRGELYVVKYGTPGAVYRVVPTRR